MTGAKSKQSSRARKGFQSKSSKNTNVNENIAGGYYKENDCHRGNDCHEKFFAVIKSGHSLSTN